MLGARSVGAKTGTMLSKRREADGLERGLDFSHGITVDAKI